MVDKPVMTRNERAEVHANRRPGGAVHRGMVWLLRHEVRWLVEVLIACGLVPSGEYGIELLPTEAWPVGEENRAREIRADLVVRLWPGAVPARPSLALIRTSHVIGLILDFQDHRDPAKEVRLFEYASAYPPIVGPHLILVVVTLREVIARWMRRVLAGKRLGMTTCVLSPHEMPRQVAIDVAAEPRHALLEAMIHFRDETDLPLVCNALRALRSFEGNELLIYREMLVSHMSETMLRQAHHAIEFEDDDDDDISRWDDYVLTKRERESLLFTRGVREGREEGREEAREEARQAALAEARTRAVFDVLALRGIPVDERSAATIRACDDDSCLREWLARALRVDRVEQLF